MNTKLTNRERQLLTPVGFTEQWLRIRGDYPTQVHAFEQLNGEVKQIRGKGLYKNYNSFYHSRICVN
jgi:hypothetical protein